MGGGGGGGGFGDGRMGPASLARGGWGLLLKLAWAGGGTKFGRGRGKRGIKYRRFVVLGCGEKCEPKGKKCSSFA